MDAPDIGSPARCVGYDGRPGGVVDTSQIGVVVAAAAAAAAAVDGADGGADG